MHANGLLVHSTFNVITQRIHHVCSSLHSVFSGYLTRTPYDDLSLFSLSLSLWRYHLNRVAASAISPSCSLLFVRKRAMVTSSIALPYGFRRNSDAMRASVAGQVSTFAGRVDTFARNDEQGGYYILPQVRFVTWPGRHRMNH